MQERSGDGVAKRCARKTGRRKLTARDLPEWFFSQGSRYLLPAPPIDFPLDNPHAYASRFAISRLTTYDLTIFLSRFKDGGCRDTDVCLVMKVPMFFRLFYGSTELLRLNASRNRSAAFAASRERHVGTCSARRQSASLALAQIVRMRGHHYAVLMCSIEC